MWTETRFRIIETFSFVFCEYIRVIQFYIEFTFLPEQMQFRNEIKYVSFKEEKLLKRRNYTIRIRIQYLFCLDRFAFFWFLVTIQFTYPTTAVQPEWNEMWKDIFLWIICNVRELMRFTLCTSTDALSMNKLHSN